VTDRTVLALSVLPAPTVLLVATAPLHDVFSTGIELVSVQWWPVLDTTSGPWFWVHTHYEYGLVPVGLFLLGRYVLTAIEPFRT
jgi:hypothetical protein